MYNGVKSVKYVITAFPAVLTYEYEKSLTVREFQRIVSVKKTFYNILQCFYSFTVEL